MVRAAGGPVGRRGFLLGVAAVAGAGALGVGTGVIPGRSQLARLVDHLPAGVPDVEPGRLVSGSFVSTAMHGARTGWTIGYPPGHVGSHLRVLVALHGRSDNHAGGIEPGGHDAGYWRSQAAAQLAFAGRHITH